LSATLRTLPRERLVAALPGGLKLAVGPFVISFVGRDALLAECLAAHYPDYPLADPQAYPDGRLHLRERTWRERLLRKPRHLCLEDERSFTNFPPGALLAHLEWSMNWCVASRANWFLMLHGAVLAREEGAIVMPGVPGAGKSTLTAYLMHRGWRLFSDEFTLLAPDRLEVTPFPRLIPLKNESIEVIGAAVPEAEFGPQIPGTRKGRVCHVKPPQDALRRMSETAEPRLVVFPRYQAGAATTLSDVPKSACFAELTQNAFNYVLLGQQAFEALAALTDRVRAFRLVYSDLAEANAVLQDALRAAA
jgi:HprK-related kinase A